MAGAYRDEGRRACKMEGHAHAGIEVWWNVRTAPSGAPFRRWRFPAIPLTPAPVLEASLWFAGALAASESAGALQTARLQSA